MTHALQPVRGTCDLLGEPLRLHRSLENIAFSTAALYGYSEIVTPIFEATDVFLKPLGETSDIVGKEMYTFEDRGGDSITLRPEGTAPVLRAIISNGLTQTMPQRRITCGPFFRYERPQKGRMRQFHQISVECLGIESFHADVEIICLAKDILTKAGVTNPVLHLNTLGDAESRTQYRTALVNYLTQHQDNLSAESQERLIKNPLRILDSKNPTDQEICQNAPAIFDHLTDKAKQFFENVCSTLTAMGIDYQTNPALVRGMDYYCHTVFEFKSDALGAQDTILGGGRYDGLMAQMGGGNVPAVGFGCGIERLSLVATGLSLAEQAPTLCLIPLGDAQEILCQKLMHQLRCQGVYCEMLLTGKVQKRLETALKKGAKFMAMVGDEDVAKGTVTLRNLHLSKEDVLKNQVVSIERLFDYL